ncbi:SURF1 family protein [Azospirillum sp. ST 5-10]|uniref:SURF1 family protein n=1 Tax=Azospirillum sp. ST 5-10 TaxID=3445776 RepID=UPI003F4A0574
MAVDGRGPGAGRPLRTLVLWGLLALAAAAGFGALGVWQLQRRAWKHDLIARVEERVGAAPVPAPGPAAWPAVDAARDEYRRVRTAGRFRHEDETLVRAVTDLGGGFWVLTPFRTDRGFTVLVNRGFVPPERRDPASRAAGQIAGETTVTGLLRVSEPGGGFLRANDPAAGRWYSRDVAAIAAARGLGEVAPYFIDADATANPGGLPAGGLTVVAFSDHHLVYALTWFALALLPAVGVAAALRGDRRRRQG